MGYFANKSYTIYAFFDDVRNKYLLKVVLIVYLFTLSVYL